MLNLTKPSKFAVHTENIDASFLGGNFVSENVLLAQYPKFKPVTDLTEPAIKYISTSSPNLSMKNASLINFMKSKGLESEIGTNRVEWRLGKRATYNFRLLRHAHAGESTPALGPDGTITVYFSNGNLVPGDIVHNLIAKDVTMIVEANLGGSTADGYEYVLRKGSKFMSFFPAWLLKNGSKWCKMGFAASEGSGGYGSFQFKPLNGYVKYEATMFKWGNKAEITDDAGQHNIVVNALDASNNPMPDQYPTMIVNAVEAEMVATGRFEKEMMLAWGQDAGTTVLDNTTQLYRRTGSGFFEWMSEAIILRYPVNNPNIDYMEDKLQSFWFDLIDYKNRNVVGMAGEGLVRWMRDAMTRKYGGAAIQSMFSTFVGSGPSYDQSNYKGLSFPTGQFTKAIFFPAGSLQWEQWDLLNSRELNGDNYYNGLPLSAYEGVIFDLGLGNGYQDNVQFLHRLGAQFFTYKCGAYSPAGYINGTSTRGFVATHEYRTYELLAGDEFGMRFKDITLPIWVKPDIVA